MKGDDMMDFDASIGLIFDSINSDTDEGGDSNVTGQILFRSQNIMN